MDRLRGVGDYLNNINRNVLVAVGLVIVAGLIAATFIYGEDGEVVDNDNGDVVTETTVNEDENGDEAEGSEREEEAEENGSPAGDNGEQPLPEELADTGPALPAAGAILLGASGYLYRRSQKQLEQARK